MKIRVIISTDIQHRCQNIKDKVAMQISLFRRGLL
jgi:hypothetical protein